MSSLLIEIGAEEIPAGYIGPALEAMSSSLIRALDDARIVHGGCEVFGTPRRLAVVVSDVADKQESLTTEVLGPPEKIGFDLQGNPQIPAVKFAEKLGVPVGKIAVRTTERGNYLCGVKKETGRSTRRILKTIIPDVIGAIPFPKTMRWSDLDFPFARPIQSLLALLGDTAILFSLDGMRSGRHALGHPFTHPGKVKIPSADRYKEALKTRGVMVDIAERKRKIETEIDAAAEGIGGTALSDADLLDVVVNLVEYPTIVVGSFDEEFLQLPREVLVTAMGKHQKYFAVVDQSNRLMPDFIAVSNTLAKDMALVAEGNERVLRARLEDAAFFYRSDLEASLEDWTGRLKGVLFQAALGSMYEKVERIKALAGYLADTVTDQRSDPVQGVAAISLKDSVLRAAQSCKADLVSQVVVEFPKLQGVMGRTYALARGESQVVADAIESHYRPTYSGGPLPETPVAAIVAIADKIDTLCGCFSAGLLPTGASDPYALRRQSIGVIQIMLDQGFTFPLQKVIEASLSAYGIDADGVTEIGDRVCEFMRNRISHLLVEEGFSRDVVSAIIRVTIDPIPHVWERARALEKLKAEPDFEPLAIAFKRVANIIKKSGAGLDGGLSADAKLFQHETESHLHQVYQAAKERVLEEMAAGNFERALVEIASMGGAVDSFFDGVMVMAEDEHLRLNRLVLLKNVADLFGLFADFSSIST